MVLARRGFSVIAFDRATKTTTPGEIISQDVRFALSSLNLWTAAQELFPLRVQGRISVWGGEATELDATLDALDGEILLERKDFARFLRDAAVTQGVQLVNDACHLRADTSHSSPSLSWSDPAGRRRTAKVDFVIEATGRSGGTAGLRARHAFDALVGLLVYPDTTGDGGFGTQFLVESAPLGWWYSAPLPGSRSVFALMTDADNLPTGRRARAEFFMRNLQAVPNTRDRYAKTGGRAPDPVVVPSRSSVRLSIGGPNWVAVGDAAVSYDPITGAGVAAAMSKGAAVARLISNEQSFHRAIAQYANAERETLDQYLRQWTAIYALETRWRRQRFWQRRERVRHVPECLRILN